MVFFEFLLLSLPIGFTESGVVEGDVFKMFFV